MCLLEDGNILKSKGRDETSITHSACSDSVSELNILCDVTEEIMLARESWRILSRRLAVRGENGLRYLADLAARIGDDKWLYFVLDKIELDYLILSDIVASQNSGVLQNILKSHQLGCEALDILSSPNDRGTLFMRIIMKEDIKSAEIILSAARQLYGQDRMLRQLFFHTLLTASQGSIKMWEIFCKNGFSPLCSNQIIGTLTKFPPLTIALRSKYWDLASVMLSQIPLERNSNLCYALDDKTWHCVLNNQKYDLWRDMVRRGVTCEKLMNMDGDSGKSWLMLVAENCDAPSMTFVLNEYKDQWYWKNAEGRTVAYFVTLSYPRVSPALEIFVDFGFDFGVADNFGYAPLYRLMYYSENQIDDELLRRVVRISSIHVPALHVAASMQSAIVVQEFINRGYPLNARDSNGCNALWYAARQGESEVAQTLLFAAKCPEQAKLMIHTRNCWGKSAYQIAMQHNRRTVLDIFDDL